MTRIVIAAALATLAAAAPTTAHATSPWKALGTTTAPLATDGERLVVTSPEADRLLVRDDQTGKAWRLALPAGCRFTGIVGGGTAAAECGAHPEAPFTGPGLEPRVLSQPRYRLVHLTTGVTRDVPPVLLSIGNSNPSPQLVAVGSRWAEFLVTGYHSGWREFVRLADGRQQTDGDQTVAADLSSTTDQVLQPLCAPLQRPVATGDEVTFGSEPHTVQTVRAGTWLGIVDGSRSLAWQCGKPAPLVVAPSCRERCPAPQLGGGFASVLSGGKARITRLRDARHFEYPLPSQLSLGAWRRVAHTKRYVYAAAENGAVAGLLRIQRRPAPKA